MTTRLTFIALMLTTLSAAAADWPHWRGPLFNGSTDETGLPVQFTQTENIRWSVELPGPSAATPIIWQDRVFLSSTRPDTDELVAMCLDRNDGSVRWQHVVAKGISRDTRSTFSAPSPITDGERVIFFFGSGPLVAYDLDGNELWTRNIVEESGPFAFLWTFSSTPLLYDGTLYLQVLQRDVPVERRRGPGGGGAADRESGIESYLMGMDPNTGQTRWQVTRPSDAYAESREAFSSPIPFEHNGRREILVVGGDCITGHDANTGEELWRWGTWNPTRIGHWRLVPSPVSGSDLILACGPKGSPIYAVKAGGNGTLPDSEIAWDSSDSREVSADVPTPAYYDGDFFVLNDLRSTLTRVDPATGEVKWSMRLPREHKFEASPTVADGKIYLINFAGQVIVVDAGTGEVLADIAMDERSESPVRSTIAVAHGNLFVRTNDRLYCVGQ